MKKKLFGKFISLGLSLTLIAGMTIGCQKSNDSSAGNSGDLKSVTLNEVAHSIHHCNNNVNLAPVHAEHSGQHTVDLRTDGTADTVKCVVQTHHGSDLRNKYQRENRGVADFKSAPTNAEDHRQNNGKHKGRGHKIGQRTAAH